MATYSIKDSTLTAIGDPIRTLMGLTNQLSPSTMATNLNDANTEVGSQTDLIAQILEAAEGKAGNSGGENIVAGTYTPASTQTSRVTITHNLGKEPTGVIFAKYHATNRSGGDTVLFIWQKDGYGIRHFVYSGTTVTSSQVSVDGANTQVHNQNHTNADIVCGLTETTFQTPQNLYAGTYIWVVFGEVLK